MTTAFDADELDAPRWTPTRIVLIIVVALIAAMWIWIFLFAPRDNPDRLATRSFPEAAERICAPIQDEIDALPLVDTETTPADRARDVAVGTDLTIEMVAALRAAADDIDETGDLRLLELWFDDWDAYVADREAYVARLLAAGPDTPLDDLAFTLTERAPGGFYTRTIEGFANANDMASCHVPGDV